MTKRIQELDSLRGIAAFIVFMSHSMGMMAYAPVIAGVNIYHTPLHMLWDGHASVIFFFLLSGYVCKKYFDTDIKINYIKFIANKMFRIYPAYLVSIITAYVFCNTFGASEPINGLSSWYNSLWVNKISFNTLIRHCILFFGHFDTGAINSVIWTLEVEMRVTFMIPVFILVMRKFRGKYKGIILSCILILVFYRISKLTILDSAFNYSYIFIMGLMLALNHDTIIKFYSKLHAVGRYFILIAGLMLYGFSFNFYSIASKFKDGTYADFIIMLGAALILIFVLGEVQRGRQFEFLKTRAIKFMGGISYSFFLWHLVILISLKKLYPVLDSYILYGMLALFLSLIISYLSVKYIEKPFIKIGKAIINKDKKV